MKRLFSAFVVLTFSVSLAAVALAEPMAGPGNTAGQAHTAGHAKAGRKKPDTHQITGTVAAIDADAGTLTVKGRRRSVSLKAGEKVVLGGINSGDRVVVKYKGKTASSVKRVRTKKRKATGKKVAGKKTPPKVTEPVKKEMAPASTEAQGEKK
jgi:hypothetical protein